MRTFLVSTLFALFSVSLLSAQSSGQSSGKTAGTLFAAVGGDVNGGDTQALLHFGGGGEALLAGGLGLGAELGYMAPMSDLGEGIGIFSPGVIVKFSRDKKTVPFVTGGYTLFFRSGTEHGFFFGGGATRWIGDSWGLRFEGRDQVMPQCSTHLIEARIAVAFR